MPSVVIHLTTHVPESRQVLLTLPPDCPVGQADLEVVVRQHDPAINGAETIHLPETLPRVRTGRPTNPKLAVEHDAFLRMLPELITRYRGQYVAFDQGTVVAVGDTEIATLNLAYTREPGALVLVRKVTDQPEPIERLPSFRPIEWRGWVQSSTRCRSIAQS
jgi:hypothetical protein